MEKVYEDVVSSGYRSWLGESRDCSVVAVSVVTGRRYGDVHRAFSASGRQPKRGATLNTILKSLELLGEKFYCKSSGWEAKTLITLEKDDFFSEGKYVVLVRGHAVPVIDGKVLDHYKGKRSRLEKVIQIL